MRNVARLRGARPAGPPPRPPSEPVRVPRRASATGVIVVCGQKIALGRAHAGQTVSIAVSDTTQARPCRPGSEQLSWPDWPPTAPSPAGPCPLPAGDGAVIEVDRTVNAIGLVSLAGQQVGVGSPLAGQRVTLRMEGPLMAVLSHDGNLLRTMACPIPATRRYRLRGARRARSLLPSRAAHHRAAASAVPGRTHGRPAEDPRRDDPRRQDRHRDLRQQPLPGWSSTASRRRRALHHHQRNPAAAGSVVSGADSFSGPADGGLARGSGAVLGGYRAGCQFGGRGP